MTAKKLLLVDDDTGIQMMLGDFLVMHGYEVSVAGSGEEALQKLAHEHPDLIILDMGMPGMGGAAFLEAITNDLGETLVPVLVLTARSGMAEYFTNRQIAGFLTKPTEPDDLLEEVKRILFMMGDLPRTASTLESIKQVLPHILIADQDDERRLALVKSFQAVKCIPVEAVSGPDAIEKAITHKPACILMPLTIDGLPPATIIDLIRKMPSVGQVPVFVYGVDCHSTARPDLIAAITQDKTELISSYKADIIVAKALPTIY